MKKTFSATNDSLREMVAFVKKQAAELGFSGQDLDRLELIAEESLINIISYAYPNGHPGMIEIDCLPADKKKGFKFIVSDHGKEFDPIANAKEVDINAPLEERTYGGYGVFFIRTITDEVSYQRIGDRNVLTMIKYLGTAK